MKYVANEDLSCVHLLNVIHSKVLKKVISVRRAMLLDLPLLANISLTILTLVISIAFYLKWALNYWERKGVPNSKPRSLFAKEKVMYERISKFYKEFKSKGHDFYGVYMFTKPMLILINPELVKNVLTKDFQHFTDHGLYYNEKEDPLSAHLFTINGEKWKKLRTKLTPAFTSGKMKMMFQTLIECSNRLLKRVDDYAVHKNEPVDIKEILACFTTDVIGSCAFGLEFNSFEDDDAEFRRYGRKVFVASRRETLKRGFLLLFPSVGKFFRMKSVPEDVANFFMSAVENTVEYREKNNYSRNDFLQILLELKRNVASNEKPLTVPEIAAQCFVFFIAGFETSSTTMTFCLYELARNKSLQDKVRTEIKAVLKKHDGLLTYETIMDMKYMDQVVDETMRKYPPGNSLIRKCTKDYVIPNTNVKLEEGTPVLVPVYALHNDPEYYPDPEKFDPERFSDNNASQRHPFVYLPFGEGPRICIGMRFGLMQTKVGLSVLLKNYSFSLSKKTKPVTLDPNTLVTSSQELIYLDVKKIE